MTNVHPFLSEPDPPLAARGGDGCAARVASRICHDLVSPLGAIANGVELLLLSGAERTPETELIAESVESANARIRLFRLAFGAAGRQPVGPSEILGTLRGLERGSRLSYDWGPTGDHPREEVKAVFLALLCLESAMPLGGSITVARADGAWEVSAETPRLRHQPEAWDSLRPDGPAAPDAASLVQFALLPLALAALGRTLELRFGPEGVRMRF